MHRRVGRPGVNDIKVACLGKGVCVCLSTPSLNRRLGTTPHDQRLTYLQLGPIPLCLPCAYLTLFTTNVPRSFPFFLLWPHVSFYAKSRIKIGIGMEHGRKLCLRCEVYYPCLFSRPLLPHLLLKRRVQRWVVLLRNNPGTPSSDIHICALGLFVFQFMLNWFFSNQVTSHDIVLCNWNFLPKMW